ncbi:hypothetical protein ABZ208_03730 [Streptomyces sp. NPDC006208]|uniref:hypothetical protein n=1 Tax=Streptomyces sp. NPDC006208 TaxID=3156734 RepID=UPI0033BB7833
MQHYGAYYRTLLHPLLQRINTYLMRWIRKKYRRLRAFKRAHNCWLGITRLQPSRVTGDFTHGSVGARG